MKKKTCSITKKTEVINIDQFENEGFLVFNTHSSVWGTARENGPKDSYLSKDVYCLKSKRAFRLCGQQHMLVHMHKLPGLDILFSLVCFLVSIQALELACFSHLRLTEVL